VAPVDRETTILEDLALSGLEDLVFFRPCRFGVFLAAEIV
jgi:hypothetical protein